MNLAIGDEPRGLLPLEGDDPLGEEPLGGLRPRGRVLAVGRVLVTVASSADGSGTAPMQYTTSGLDNFIREAVKCFCACAWGGIECRQLAGHVILTLCQLSVAACCI